MKENREKLINLIGEYFTDEQVDYLYKVLRVFTSGYLAKKDLCDLSDLADHNFDTALPQPYVDELQKIMPSFKTWSHVYDYETAMFGELKNTCEEFVVKMNNIFSNH